MELFEEEELAKLRGRSAPIDEKLRAMLGFLEKVTLAPGDVGPDDVLPLRNVGISEQAIEDALYICVYFNIIDRIADALNFFVPTQEAFALRVDMLLEGGYSQSVRPM